MNYLVCMDDTDMPGTRGTGWLVQELCEKMEGGGMGSTSPISRHQLFVHEDIPYTSHNSAMCFKITFEQPALEPVIRYMTTFLEARSEKGSDPGLCVAKLHRELDRERLIEFGKMAKETVTSKGAAYDIARKTGIHLSEHGGTGDGVIGAVAGIGLRLSGNDGRYRGWYHLGMPGDVEQVGRLLSYPFIDRLVTRTGNELSPGTRVQIGSEKTKTVRMGSRQVVVVTENETGKESGISLRTITKQEAKEY